MNNEQVSAQLIQWLAQIAASNARVAGMQSANQQRAITNSAAAYTEDWFQSEANELEHIAQAAGIAELESGTAPERSEKLADVRNSALEFMLAYENDDPNAISEIQDAFDQQSTIKDAQEFARCYCARKMKAALHSSSGQCERLCDECGADLNRGDHWPACSIRASKADSSSAAPSDDNAWLAAVREEVAKLEKYRLCMSYNDSYFTEPAGTVKRATRNLAMLMDRLPFATPSPTRESAAPSEALPHPAMVKGAHDYYSVGQMRDYGKALWAQALVEADLIHKDLIKTMAESYLATPRQPEDK